MVGGGVAYLSPLAVPGATRRTPNETGRLHQRMRRSCPAPRPDLARIAAGPYPDLTGLHQPTRDPAAPRIRAAIPIRGHHAQFAAKPWLP